VSNLTPHPASTTVLQRLLGVLPEKFSTDPLPVDALRLSAPSGQPVVGAVADGWLTVTTADPAYRPVRLDLRDHTLNTLVQWLDAHAPEYQASLIDPTVAGLRATVLLEGRRDLTDLSTENWPRFTAPNHQLLSALALAVADLNARTERALAQTDQRVASEEWADFHGQFLGVPRRDAEVGDDAAYRMRVRRDAVLEKSNNRAIEALLLNATGLRCTVVDGGNPWTFSTAVPGEPLALGSGLPLIGTDSDADDLPLLGPQSGAGSFVCQLLDPLGQYTVADVTSMITSWKAAGIAFTVEAAP
jgi:hypothetical protein